MNPDDYKMYYLVSADSDIMTYFQARDVEDAVSTAEGMINGGLDGLDEHERDIFKREGYFLAEVVFQTV